MNPIITIGHCPANGHTYCGPADEAPVLLETRINIAVRHIEDVLHQVRHVFGWYQVRGHFYAKVRPEHIRPVVECEAA